MNGTHKRLFDIVQDRRRRRGEREDEYEHEEQMIRTRKRQREDEEMENGSNYFIALANAEASIYPRGKSLQKKSRTPDEKSHKS